MRRSLIPALSLLLLGAGCSRPVDDPALRAGDVVRPEIAFAPKAPWPTGADAKLGMLIRVNRRETEPRYLRDDEVVPEHAVMRGRVTFLTGDNQLGDPIEVPFVRDC